MLYRKKLIVLSVIVTLLLATQGCCKDWVETLTIKFVSTDSASLASNKIYRHLDLGDAIDERTDWLNGQYENDYSYTLNLFGAPGSFFILEDTLHRKSDTITILGYQSQSLACRVKEGGGRYVMISINGKTSDYIKTFHLDF